MFVAMNEINIPQKLIRLVKIMYNMKSQIKIQSKLSAPFIIQKGVRQGGPLACLQCNVALEYAIRKSGIQTRCTICYKSLQLMVCANDIVIIDKSSSNKRDFSATCRGK